MLQRHTSVLILTRLSLIDAGPVALARIRRRRVLCLHLDKRAIGISRLLSVEMLDTDLLSEVQSDERSYDEAMTTFAECAAKWLRAIKHTPLVEAGVRGLDDYVVGIFQVALMKSATRYAQDLYRSTLWLKTVKPANATVRCDSQFEQLVFKSCLGMSGEVRVVRRRLAIFSRLMALSRGLVDVVGSRSKGSNRKSMPTSPAAGAADPSGVGLRARALLFLNDGLTYGSLYSYDFLLDDKPGAAASWSNAVVVSREGGRLSNGVASSPWPSSRLGLKSRLRMFTPISKRTPIPAAALRVLRETYARALTIRAAVQRLYPQLELAIYSFDTQVPAEYSLAFELAGIRTIAIHERPLTAATASAPIAVDTLLTASQYFSDQVLSRGVHAVRRTQPIGMWRTDLLIASSSANAPNGAQRPNVLVLPFALSEKVESAWPFTTTRGAVSGFLIDMACLAATRPDANFFVRGKSVEWLTRENFPSFFRAVDELPNLAISLDYSPNASYELLKLSNLVVGKHTSLIDEALSANIPCIVHDYASNTRNYARFLIGYIPEFAWAESRQELVTKVSEVLDDRGERFRAQWETHRARVFGTEPDGRVRQRYAAIINEVLTR